MKYSFIVLLCLIAAVAAQAQQVQVPKLLFEQDSIYIGRIKMPDSSIEQVFNFKVLPGQRVKIAEVKPDCACSIASFPTRQMDSGDIGQISVRFSPYKLGPFEKRFAILFDDETIEPVELLLKGYIAPDQPDVALDYPHRCGNLRLQRKMVSFGGIGNSTLVKQRITFYNDSDYPIAFQDSMELPAHIEVVIDTPRIIPPRSVCEAAVFYHPELKNNFGYSLDNIRLFTDDPQGNMLELEVAAIIRPETQVKNPNSPVLWVSPEEMDLGEVPVARDFIVSFMLYNRGNDDLQIKKVVPQANVEVLSLDKETVKKGEFATLRVQITGLAGQKGPQLRNLQLYTNDPARPFQMLIVKVAVP